MAHAEDDSGGIASQLEELRGAIDRFEGDLAVVVFDDGQQLDLPRAGLPAEARSGDVVVARAGTAGTWHGAWQAGGVFALDDDQALDWPGGPDSGEAWLSLEIDAEDTAARRKGILGLLDDLFGP